MLAYKLKTTIQLFQQKSNCVVVIATMLVFTRMDSLLLILLLYVVSSLAANTGLTVYNPPSIEGNYLSSPIVTNARFRVAGQLVIVQPMYPITCKLAYPDRTACSYDSITNKVEIKATNNTILLFTGI